MFAIVVGQTVVFDGCRKVFVGHFFVDGSQSHGTLSMVHYLGSAFEPRYGGGVIHFAAYAIIVHYAQILTCFTSAASVGGFFCNGFEVV